MNFTQLIANEEIWIEIFRKLVFEDQLHLSRVNKVLQLIFETHIWRENYQYLEIKYNIDTNDYVIANGKDGNRLCLSEALLKEFLNSYGERVESLLCNRTPWLHLKQFPNLKRLSLVDMRISYDQLKMINECSQQLESLFLSCLTQEECEFVELGKNWSIKKVLQLKHLKHLRLDHEDYVAMKYRHFRRIITRLPLENLEMKATIMPDEKVIKSDNKISQPIQLKKLDIATVSFDFRKWSENFSWYLRNFENLQFLKIKINETITDETLATLKKICRKLESLHLHHSNFDEINEFPLPDNLKELQISHCRGLNITVVEQILKNHKQLRKFIFHDADFENSAGNLSIPPTLETLDVEGVDTEKFLLNNVINRNLKELTWYREKLFKDSRDILKPLELSMCQAVQTLNIKEGYIDLETLMQLKSLTKLMIPHPLPLLNWSYLEGLLKHPSLLDLTIGNHNGSSSSKIFKPAIATAGFKTTIKRLQLPLDLFDAALDFWLNMFALNEDLSLICCKFTPHDMESFLKKLIQNKNFPEELQTIDVCCFTIDCTTLRQNFDEIVERLQRITVNYYGYEYTDDVFRLKISRILNR
ncbi:uncharacterized protein LOC142234949 [Haematobia irritans]|uniref:uncharacterized protein LOC142234949 n=1 Tax=Haematobia irritans TaxID=7368 RepID=UPI003F505D62